MFTELMPLLRKRRLLLTISLIERDTIRATVVPQKASDHICLLFVGNCGRLKDAGKVKPYHL